MGRALRPADLALLLALGVIWGTAFMFISLGLRSFSPLLFAALRFDISGVFVFALAVVLGRKGLMPRGARQWGAIAVAGLMNVALYHGFLFWGQQFTTAGIAAVIVGLNPVITTAFSRGLLRDERLGRGGLLGLALGLLGIVLLASLKPGSLLDARGLGEVAVVVAIGAWALGSVLVKRADHGMDVFAFTGWHALVGAGVLHVTSLALEGGGSAVWDLEGTLSLLYLALASSGVGFVMYFTLLQRIGPIRTNLVSHIAPVFATLAAFLVLAEALEARAAIAFALIASGFWLVTRTAKAPPGPATPLGEGAASGRE